MVLYFPTLWKTHWGDGIGGGPAFTNRFKITENYTRTALPISKCLRMTSPILVVENDTQLGFISNWEIGIVINRIFQMLAKFLKSQRDPSPSAHLRGYASAKRGASLDHPFKRGWLGFSRYYTEHGARNSIGNGVSCTRNL